MYEPFEAQIKEWLTEDPSLSAAAVLQRLRNIEPARFEERNLRMVQRQTELKLDPHSGVTVIFRSKRGDRLKILVWDGTGMVLTYKILEHGSFAWPKVRDGTMRLSRGQ